MFVELKACLSSEKQSAKTYMQISMTPYWLSDKLTRGSGEVLLAIGFKVLPKAELQAFKDQANVLVTKDSS